MNRHNSEKHCESREHRAYLGEVGEHLRMVRGEVETLVKPLCKVMQLLPDKAEQKIYHYHRSNQKNSTYAVDKFGQI